jgi:hypothetical protein
MAPKKGAVEEKILLGRPGNNLKSGIVGCLRRHGLLGSSPLSARLTDWLRANRSG